MNFDMPLAFPKNAFDEFEKIAATLFPAALDDIDLADSSLKRLHFQSSWLAVYYRYRACVDQNIIFSSVFDEAMSNDLWREWSVGDYENYKLEQCIYCFFMNALSALESFCFCLYYVGSELDDKNFQKINNQRCITIKTTQTAFKAAFPNSSISQSLEAMIKNPSFIRIDMIRNILAHRIVGKRNVSVFADMNLDGIQNEKRIEHWYILGLNDEIHFDIQFLKRSLDDLSSLITDLVAASLEFAKSKQ